ncbi:MAG: hypothetical protein ACFE89_00750 [Candidatus Hodarchaeota archaeon]
MGMGATRSIKAFSFVQILYSLGMMLWATQRYLRSIAPTSLFHYSIALLWVVIPVDVFSIGLALMMYRAPSRMIWRIWLVRWFLGFFFGCLLLGIPRFYVGPEPPPSMPPELLWGAIFEPLMSVASLAWLYIDRKAYLK